MPCKNSTRSARGITSSQGGFHCHCQGFYQRAGSPDKKQRSRLIDQFNHLKRNLDFRFRALPDKKSQILLERILAHTQFSDRVERQLLTGAEDFSEVKARFEAEAWQQLDPTDGIRFLAVWGLTC